MSSLGKGLIVLGLVIAAVGVAMTFSDKVSWLGRLPGDINIKKENFQVSIPITTSIILSLLLSLIFWVISFFTKK